MGNSAKTEAFFTDFSSDREQAEDLSKRFKIGGHIIRLLFTSSYYKPKKSRIGPEIYLKHRRLCTKSRRSHKY